MVSRRTASIVALALVAILAVPTLIWFGFRGDADVTEGRHEPVTGPGDNPFTTDLKHLSVKGARVEGAPWCTDHAVFRNGTYAIFLRGPCNEPEPLRTMPSENLSVAFRLDDPYPVRLAPNETLRLTNSFHASYQRLTMGGWDHDWRLDPNASWFEVHTVEHLDGRVGGAFHLEFENATGERVTLEGVYPKPHRRAPDLAAPAIVLVLAATAALLVAAPRAKR